MMSLYDDIIPGTGAKSDGAKSDSGQTGWSSSGINFLQDHLQMKKNQFQGKKETMAHRRSAAGVGFGFKTVKVTKLGADEMAPPPVISAKDTKITGSLLGGDWDITQEYDPLWPNDYEKIMKERKEVKERERAEERSKELNERERKRRERFEKASDPIITPTMSARSLVDAYSDDDEEPDTKTVHSVKSRTGAAIAPPPSLTESSCQQEPGHNLNIASTMGVSNVAAKIMVKMGYREGQGLGKEEQGISRALEVEKTSKRGGKIISSDLTPDTESFVPPVLPPVALGSIAGDSQTNEGPSITEIMKNPTKVVTLRNMVGPGEVDADLEPEVKEECGKYGDVIACMIYEFPEGLQPPEEAVRIFVEFKRVESAIKAVVDLNGRYFGGRTVRAAFYDPEKFKRLELKD